MGSEARSRDLGLHWLWMSHCQLPVHLPGSLHNDVLVGKPWIYMMTLMMQLPRMEVARVQLEQPRAGKFWTSTTIMPCPRLRRGVAGRVRPWRTERGLGTAECTSEDGQDQNESLVVLHAR